VHRRKVDKGKANAERRTSNAQRRSFADSAFDVGRSAFGASFSFLPLLFQDGLARSQKIPTLCSGQTLPAAL